MATIFNGKLNSNEILAIYNMIISQQVFADNLDGDAHNLVDQARVDGSLFGDTKLYYATDALKSHEWGNDEEATNLLAIARPDAPKCQPITLDKFRQIDLTLDQYLSKRAFADEGAFSSFNSVMQQWIQGTKKLYDNKTYKAFIGTVESNVGKQEQVINITTETEGLTGEEKRRVEAGVIGEAVAKLLTDMADETRDYNEYGFMRSYSAGKLKFIWNSDAVAGIQARDLPTIYHQEIIDKFNEYSLPGKYFGTVVTSAGTADGVICSLIEQVVSKSGSADVHVFPGEVIPAGYTVPANTAYKPDNTILFKVFGKLPPYMSAFEVGTSFFNPKSLTETHYLTWGHNTLTKLDNYPCVTVRKA